MVKLNKKSKAMIIICIGVLAIAILLGGTYLFINNDHKLLDVTSECIAAYEKEGIYITGGMLEVSFDQLEYAVNRNMDLINNVPNEFHKKYNALLKKNKQFYTLTDEECYELNFSAGTKESIELVKNQILETGKSLRIWTQGDTGTLRYSFADS